MSKKDKKRDKRNRKTLRKALKVLEKDPAYTGGCLTHEVHRYAHKTLDRVMKALGIK